MNKFTETSVHLFSAGTLFALAACGSFTGQPPSGTMTDPNGVTLGTAGNSNVSVNPNTGNPTTGPGASCGPSEAGLYAFYRLEPLNCNASDCPSPALGARVVVTDNPNYCAEGNAPNSNFLLSFPPLRAVNTVTPPQCEAGVSCYYGVTYATSGNFNDTQPAKYTPVDFDPVPHFDSTVPLDQPFATDSNAPFATFTQAGQNVGTTFTTQQSLTFDYNQTVTNLHYNLTYDGNVSDANARSGSIAQATACNNLDPSVVSDSTLAAQFDLSTMKYLVYVVTAAQEAGPGDTGPQTYYSPEAYLTDRADFCDLLTQNNHVAPADVRWLNFYNDTNRIGPDGFPVTGAISMGSSWTSLGAQTYWNVPGLGAMRFTGSENATLGAGGKTFSIQSVNLEVYVDGYEFAYQHAVTATSVACSAIIPFPAPGSIVSGN